MGAWRRIYQIYCYQKCQNQDSEDKVQVSNNRSKLKSILILLLYIEFQIMLSLVLYIPSLLFLVLGTLILSLSLSDLQKRLGTILYNNWIIVLLF